MDWCTLKIDFVKSVWRDLIASFGLAEVKKGTGRMRRVRTLEVRARKKGVWREAR